MAKLYNLAKLLRSKNSGPFETTLDILFDDPAQYRYVVDSGRISRKIIAELYHIPEENISHLVFFDAAYGIKVTFQRSISSGTVGDRDVYGAQQHAPLMELEIP